MQENIFILCCCSQLSTNTPPPPNPGPDKNETRHKEDEIAVCASGLYESRGETYHSTRLQSSMPEYRGNVLMLSRCVLSY